ncbi:MAG: NmrA family NAD(P)-binding protein [Candidatus Promineifilaceae bacterium]
MVLVTGAAGKTGTAIIDVMKTDNQSVRALVHRKEQVNRVTAAGAKEAVIGDMRDRALMYEAMSGMRKVYHICPNVSPDELTIGKLAIDAARENRLDHFVYHSVLHPQVEMMPHHWLKMRVEEAIFESGLSFTILQPAPYMQNIVAGWEAIVSSGIYAVPYDEETRLAQVDLGDVAQVALKVLTTPDHAGAVYELCGPEALSQIEIAAIIGDRLGIQVNTRQIDRLDWEVQAKARGLGNYQIETLLRMFDYYERFGFIGNSNVINLLLGRRSTSFAAFIDGHVQA